MADFETVSTSSLQIRVKIPRSPSPSVCSQRNSVLRSSSMRSSRLDQPARAASAQRTTGASAVSNTLSVRPSAYKTSRSLSPRHSVSILRPQIA